MKSENYASAVIRYAIGGMLAAILTIITYLMVVQSWFHGATLAFAVISLAIVQFVVQLYTFLHFGADRRPRWRTWTLAFTVFSLLVIIGGSLWIMNNLDYRMMVGPDAMNEYMIEQNKKGF